MTGSVGKVRTWLLIAKSRKREDLTTAIFAIVGDYCRVSHVVLVLESTGG